MDEKIYSFDEAKALAQQDRVAGLKVKGSRMPFGGRWRYDKAADELTLELPPTILPA